MLPIKKSSPKVVHENPFSKVLHVKADFSDFSKNYYVTHFGPRTGIVVVRDGQVLLVRQYRLLPDRLTLEIPGGTVLANEKPEDAAQRECLEETGIVCSNLKSLVVYYPGLDNVENRTSLFFGEMAQESESFLPDPKEIVEIVWMPIDECLQKIFIGELIDGMTIIGVLAYHALAGKKDAKPTGSTF